MFLPIRPFTRKYSPHKILHLHDLSHFTRFVTFHPICQHFFENENVTNRRMHCIKFLIELNLSACIINAFDCLTLNDKNIVQEQNVKMPRIVLSPHDKPQIIGQMMVATTLEHARSLSKQFGGLVEKNEDIIIKDNNNNVESSRTDVNTEPIYETKKRKIKKKVEFNQEVGLTQKTIRVSPGKEKLGLSLIWGLQTGLQDRV